jgi:hypothetical protein
MIVLTRVLDTDIIGLKFINSEGCNQFKQIMLGTVWMPKFFEVDIIKNCKPEHDHWFIVLNL